MCDFWHREEVAQWEFSFTKIEHAASSNFVQYLLNAVYVRFDEVRSNYNIMTEIGEYFKNHCDKVIRGLTVEDVNNFVNANSNEERIKYWYKHAVRVQIDMAKGGKDYKLALLSKDSGNKSYRDNEFQHAILEYNRGLLKCPQDTPEGRTLAAILVANRSAVFYEMKHYRKALSDIKYVKLLGGYPQHLLHKILMREGKCFLGLHSHEDALMVYEAARNAVVYMKVTTKVLAEKEQEINNAIEEVRDNINICPGYDLEVEEKKGYEFPRNGLYPAASSSVEFDDDSVQGRFAKAVRDILPGEVVLEELPHCLVVSAESVASHCTYCGVSTNNPCVCVTCSYGVFCTVDCMSEAIYHVYECPILTTLYTSGASINCTMALRIITQRDFEYFWQRKDTIDSHGLTYLHSDYGRVYNLCTHENLRPKGEFVHYTLMAIFLLRLLKKTSYFPYKTDDSVLTNEESFIGSLILRHLQILQFNAHEVFELQNCISEDALNNKSNYKSAHVGGALYPTLALFNHSCEPSIIRYFKGKRIIVRAIKLIKQGEIICENYGPIYSSREIGERRSILLERYWFNCNCTPCRERWPLFANMPLNTLRLACTKCKTTNVVAKDSVRLSFNCSLCKTTNSSSMPVMLELIEADYGRKIGDEHLERCDFKPAEGEYCRALQLYGKHFVPPFQDLVTIQQHLRTCMLHDGYTEFNYRGPKYIC